MHENAPTDDWKSRFEKRLERIQQIVRETSRRNGLGLDETSDFRSYVMLKLIENDYARFRKYRGESTLETYLTTVVVRLLLDYRREKWGKWRSSAKAQSLGPTAIRLEMLVYRDGHEFRDAAEVLDTEWPGRVEDLQALFIQLPVRHRARPIQAEFFDIADNRPTTWLLEAAQAAKLSGELEKTLRLAFTQLDEESQLLLRLRFQGGLSIKQTATALGLKPHSLYPRFERILRRLRAQLETQGLTRTDVLATSRYAQIDIDLGVITEAPQNGNASSAAV